MSPRALNLLRYPQPTWSVNGWLLYGILAGMCGVLGLAGWLQAQHTGSLQQHQHWTQQLDRQLQQQAQQRALRERQRTQIEQQLFWRKAHAQERQRLDLQVALQREAQQGLRLTRWQSDGQRQWLQGQLPKTEDLPGLQARLGQTLGQPWLLQSLGGEGASSDLFWVLEAPWPPASTSRGTP